MLYPYRETLLSHLYPGNQHSTHCLKAAVEDFENILKWERKKQIRVIWRLDGGFGADKNINWLAGKGYDFVVKGGSSPRGAMLARQVKRWISVRDDMWVGRVATPKDVKYEVETFALRYLTRKGIKHKYIFSTLGFSGRKTLLFYDLRGGAETEFRTDKSGGFFLQKRRKQKFLAQVVWVILTDMAHNYLSWFRHHILADSPFANWGPLRIGRDLFRIPGHIEMSSEGVLSVSLLESHPYASDLLPYLARFCE